MNTGKGFLIMAGVFIVTLLVMLWNPFNLNNSDTSVLPALYFLPFFGFVIYKLVKYK